MRRGLVWMSVAIATTACTVTIDKDGGGGDPGDDSATPAGDTSHFDTSDPPTDSVELSGAAWALCATSITASTATMWKDETILFDTDLDAWPVEELKSPSAYDLGVDGCRESFRTGRAPGEHPYRIHVLTAEDAEAHDLWWGLEHHYGIREADLDDPQAYAIARHLGASDVTSVVVIGGSRQGTLYGIVDLLRATTPGACGTAPDPAAGHTARCWGSPYAWKDRPTLRVRATYTPYAQFTGTGGDENLGAATMFDTVVLDAYGYATFPEALLACEDEACGVFSSVDADGEAAFCASLGPSMIGNPLCATVRAERSKDLYRLRRQIDAAVWGKLSHWWAADNVLSELAVRDVRFRTSDPTDRDVADTVNDSLAGLWQFADYARGRGLSIVPDFKPWGTKKWEGVGMEDGWLLEPLYVRPTSMTPVDFGVDGIFYLPCDQPDCSDEPTLTDPPETEGSSVRYFANDSYRLTMGPDGPSVVPVDLFPGLTCEGETPEDRVPCASLDDTPIHIPLTQLVSGTWAETAKVPTWRYVPGGLRGEEHVLVVARATAPDQNVAVTLHTRVRPPQAVGPYYKPAGGAGLDLTATSPGLVQATFELPPIEAVNASFEIDDLYTVQDDLVVQIDVTGAMPEDVHVYRLDGLWRNTPCLDDEPHLTAISCERELVVMPFAVTDPDPAGCVTRTVVAETEPTITGGELGLEGRPRADDIQKSTLSADGVTLQGDALVLGHDPVGCTSTARRLVVTGHSWGRLVGEKADFAGGPVDFHHPTYWSDPSACVPRPSGPSDPPTCHGNLPREIDLLHRDIDLPGGTTGTLAQVVDTELRSVKWLEELEGFARSHAGSRWVDEANLLTPADSITDLLCRLKLLFDDEPDEGFLSDGDGERRCDDQPLGPTRVMISADPYVQASGLAGEFDLTKWGGAVGATRDALGRIPRSYVLVPWEYGPLPLSIYGMLSDLLDPSPDNPAHDMQVFGGAGMTEANVRLWTEGAAGIRHLVGSSSSDASRFAGMVQFYYPTDVANPEFGWDMDRVFDARVMFGDATWAPATSVLEYHPFDLPGPSTSYQSFGPSDPTWSYASGTPPKLAPQPNVLCGADHFMMTGAPPKSCSPDPLIWEAARDLRYGSLQIPEGSGDVVLGWNVPVALDPAPDREPREVTVDFEMARDYACRVVARPPSVTFLFSDGANQIDSTDPVVMRCDKVGDWVSRFVATATPEHVLWWASDVKPLVTFHGPFSGRATDPNLIDDLRLLEAVGRQRHAGGEPEPCDNDRDGVPSRTWDDPYDTAGPLPADADDCDKLVH